MQALQLLLTVLFSRALSQYCSSGPSTLADTTLYAISLQGDSTRIQDTSLPCPGYAGVRDLTSQLADLAIGKTYEISYNVSSCGGIYTQLSAVWIDYNANFIFESFELLFNYSSIYGYQTHSFTVPATAMLGNTRIRVQVQETYSATIDPCSIFNYGGTTDASVSIKPGSGAYCVSGPTTGNDMNLGPVQLTGFTMSINDNTDCPTVIGPRDLTALIADVNSGSSYTLNYKVTDCNDASSAWPTLSGAWIDYDGDGSFEDWEAIGVSQQNGLADVSLQFSVPWTSIEQEVIPGNTYLRVQVQETNAEILDPCAHFAWGGTKDFTIRIWEPKNYCVSGPTSASGDTALGGVTLTGQTVSINDPATCADSKAGPVDNTLMVADLIQGSAYTLTWNVLGCGDKVQQTQSAAWVDYNHNEVFEAWEQITPRSGQSGTVTYSFKVPPTSPNQVVVGGPTRLRVQVQQTTSTGALDPCVQFINGGTRDYTVNILNATSTMEEESSNFQYGGRDRYARIKAITN